MQISRLFEIVYLLLERRSVTARELAERFEVSPRTIYRDVDALAQAGIPVYADRGQGGGIRLMEQFVLNKSLLSVKERRELLASVQGMQAVREEEVQPLLEKLSSLFGAEREDWIEVDFSPWTSSGELGKYFQLLKEAILNHDQTIALGHLKQHLIVPRLVAGMPDLNPVQKLFLAQFFHHH